METILQRVDHYNIWVYSTQDKKQRNSILVLGYNRALLIDPADDPGFVAETKRILAGRDIWVLYSHSHVNHLQGVRHFPYKRIISQSELPSSSYFVDSGLPFPTHVYQERMEIDLGKLVLKLIHLPGHTRDLTAVSIPAWRMVFASDLLLENDFPLLSDGTIRQYMQSLQKLNRIDFRLLIPGHGRVSSGTAILERVHYYLDQLSHYLESCTSYEEILSVPVSNFQNTPYSSCTPEFHAINIKAVWEARMISRRS